MPLPISEPCAGTVAGRGIGRKLFRRQGFAAVTRRGPSPAGKGKVPEVPTGCRNFPQPRGRFGTRGWSVSAQTDEVAEAAAELLGRQPDLHGELLQLARLLEIAALQPDHVPPGAL